MVGFLKWVPKMGFFSKNGFLKWGNMVYMGGVFGNPM